MSEAKFKPQFPLDEIYVAPFRWRRGFDETTLKNIWVPLPDARRRTGVNILDAVVDKLIQGQETKWIARDYGLTSAQLNSVVLALTGLRLQELESKWRARRCGELLRYTNLSITEIMKRCGFTSRPSFSRFVSENFGLAPRRFRAVKRQPGELGMYAV
jgi:transcriptional regulator GlxA family with amidase domain